MKQRPAQLTFDRKLGVFKDWREDTEDLLSSMFQLDIECSKLNRVVKDPVDYDSVL